LAYISASVNGFAAAQFKLAPSTDGGVRWSALELLSGPVDGVTLVDDFELHFMNYLQVRSVVGGTSTLTIDLETQPSSGWLRSVELLPDTSVLESDMAPADIEMETSGKADISAGGSGELLVRLRSAGRNASDVKVFAHSLHNVLELTDSDQAVASVTAAGTNVRIGLSGTGSDVIQVEAKGRTGGNEVQYLEVSTVRSGGYGRVAAVGAAVVLGISAVVLAIVLARRRVMT
jgi:hypothetical protein